jgi:hypothetical protein
MKKPERFHKRKHPVLGPDDYKRRRRERRMDRTRESETTIHAWAQKQGLSLRVLNGGHHWMLEQPGFVAEWWPSSAKLALNRDYLKTFHAPHWSDVMAVLERQSFSKSLPKAKMLPFEGNPG